jgi:hypothetical protein
MPNHFWQSFLIVFSLALLITYFTYDDQKMLGKLKGKLNNGSYRSFASKN